MSTILALVNQKGGCGKTTSAIHVAAGAVEHGLRVLLVDLDPQGHAALGLGIESAGDRPALSEVLAHSPLSGGGEGLETAIVTARPGLDVVPGNLGLAGLELRLSNALGREERLAEHLASLVSGWDLVIIDSPPNLGLLTVNALMAANEVLIPLEPSRFALHGLDRVLGTIGMLRERTRHVVSCHALACMVNRRDHGGLALLDAVEAQRPGLLLPRRVRRSVLLPRAAATGRHLGETSPRAPAWRDYLEVTRVLVEVWQRSGRLRERAFGGLRHTPEGLAFSHDELPPDQVLLAGDFNAWIPDRGVELERNGDGGWTKTIEVPPGRYAYKFIVAGTWSPDPCNPRRATNEWGVQNSLVEVPTPVVPRPGPREHRTSDHA
jgi:chromosome partitioning protein